MTATEIIAHQEEWAENLAKQFAEGFRDKFEQVFMDVMEERLNGNHRRHSRSEIKT